MINKTRELGKQMVVTTVSIFVVLMVSSSSVLAQGGGSNFICDQATALEGALEGLLTVFVVIAGLAAVAGGTFFTLASAVNPSKADDYSDNRNQAILYGLGSLVILYGGDAIVSQINGNLSYSCVLPFQ